MKHSNQILLTIISFFLLVTSHSQTVNWKNLGAKQKHIVSASVGFDHATTAVLGYGYHINTRWPLVVGVDYSMPFGKRLLDDFKTRVGGQLNLLRLKNFLGTVKAYGVFRRYENQYATLFNFGSEFSATMGYYRHKWWAAGEFGFDKAIVTHIRHSSLMLEYNPGLQSGWYIPTGGNAFYGIQAGYSFKRNEVYTRFGKTTWQDFKTDSPVPYYFQLGWNLKL
jgi:hypothetical protein